VSDSSDHQVERKIGNVPKPLTFNHGFEQLDGLAILFSKHMK